MLSAFLKFTRRYYFYEGQKVKIWRLAAPPSCACRTHFTGSIIIRSAARRGVRPNHGELQGVHEILCFFQEFSKVCHLSLASTRLLIVVQKLAANRSDLHSHCVETFEGLLQRYRRGRGCTK